MRLLIRQPGDVILETIQRYLNLGEAGFSPAAKIVYHDLEMVAMLQKYKNSLGMLTRSSIYGIKAGIDSLAVDDVTPTTENVAAGKYKFAVEYGLVYKDHLNGLAQSFIDFIFSEDGKNVMNRHGVATLSRP
jgi:ABC-type phosphate transport system substrate-binding protein